MENFFNWMSKTVPSDEVQIWMNRYNIIPEKVSLYGDFAKTLHIIISKTYLGYEDGVTKIKLSDEEMKGHFEWSWNKVLEIFAKENIKFNNEGEHKEYFESFFMDVFYLQDDNVIRDSIDEFITDLFVFRKKFTKSDLEILTEVYKSLEKNII